MCDLRGWLLAAVITWFAVTALLTLLGLRVFPRLGEWWYRSLALVAGAAPLVYAFHNCDDVGTMSLFIFGSFGTLVLLLWWLERK